MTMATATTTKTTTMCCDSSSSSSSHCDILWITQKIISTNFHPVSYVHVINLHRRIPATHSQFIIKCFWKLVYDVRVTHLQAMCGHTSSRRHRQRNERKFHIFIVCRRHRRHHRRRRRTCSRTCCMCNVVCNTHHILPIINVETRIAWNGRPTNSQRQSKNYSVFV